MKRQGGGIGDPTGSYRRLWQRDVSTDKIRTEHMDSGEQKLNGDRRTGPRRGETRDVRNVFIRVSDTMRSKRGHTVEENAPKREDESPYIKRY